MPKEICEIYANQDKIKNQSVTPEDQKMAKGIGLESYSNALWAKKVGLKQLSQEDLEVWARYLPSTYRTDVQETQKVRNINQDGITVDMIARFETQLPWKSYAFHEGVPFGTMQLIQTVQKHFDVLEIRTPENVSILVQDPVLIGWIGSVPYLLARWAESAEHLISIDKIKQIFKAEDDLTNTQSNYENKNAFLCTFLCNGKAFFWLCVCIISTFLSIILVSHDKVFSKAVFCYMISIISFPVLFYYKKTYNCYVEKLQMNVRNAETDLQNAKV